jgi:carbonic anhydrase
LLVLVVTLWAAPSWSAEPEGLSAEQIAEFAAIYGHNNRPTQPLRGRSLVLEKIE